MFSLFKKRQIEVTIEEYEEKVYIAGMSTRTANKSYKKDVKELQQRFYAAREKLVERSNPSGTMVIHHLPGGDGSFTYFVGDLVDTPKQPSPMAIVTLEPGKYAHIHVKFKVPNDLALSVARARKYFMDIWLPASGYAVKAGIESMELYDQRSYIRLPSIELIFPLEKPGREEH